MINPKAYRWGAEPSCIRELYHYGRDLARTHGEEVVCDFSLGNPMTPPPPAVLDAFRRFADHPDPREVHGYTVAGGDPSARWAIACDLNARFGASVGAEDLFLTAGACPALVAVFGALTLSPKSEFIAVAPYFPEYRTLVEAAGATFKAVPVKVDDFGIDLPSLAALITPLTQGVILNSPNNPSGVVYARETLCALASLLTEKSREVGHPIYLICDEPYRELVYDGTEVPYLPHIYPDTVVCYSYSQSLSLPGDRIGYVLVPPTATDARALYLAVAGAARASGHVCAPALLQRVVAACASVRPDLTAYERNRRLLYDTLTSYGYRCVYPNGAFYLLVEAPEGDGKAFSDRARKEGLLAVPGVDFGCPTHVRLSYCVSEDTVRRALPIFRRLIETK